MRLAVLYRAFDVVFVVLHNGSRQIRFYFSFWMICAKLKQAKEIEHECAPNKQASKSFEQNGLYPSNSSSYYDKLLAYLFYCFACGSGTRPYRGPEAGSSDVLHCCDGLLLDIKACLTLRKGLRCQALEAALGLESSTVDEFAES